jgi:hypothetical protein
MTMKNICIIFVVALLLATTGVSTPPQPLLDIHTSTSDVVADALVKLVAIHNSTVVAAAAAAVAVAAAADSAATTVAAAVEISIFTPAMIRESLDKLEAIHNSTVDAAAIKNFISTQDMIGKSLANLVAIQNSTTVNAASIANSFDKTKDILASWTGYKMSTFVLGILTLVMKIWCAYKLSNFEKLLAIQTSAAPHTADDTAETSNSTTQAVTDDPTAESRGFPYAVGDDEPTGSSEEIE